MLWRGLTTFGRGLVTAILGVLTQSASSLVKDDSLALVLTTIGIVVFVAGLYMALVGMDNQFKEFKKFVFARINITATRTLAFVLLVFPLPPGPI